MKRNRMSKKKSDKLEADEQLHMVLENGADFKQRRLYLAGEITEATCYKFLIGLQALDMTKGAITVVLNSCGGLCTEGYAIYDAIRFAQNEVYIVVFGQASSMGSAILQAGERRIMSPESEFMIHDVANWNSGDLSLHDAKLLAKDLQRLQDRMNRILSTRSGQPIPKIQQWCRDETTFTAEQALESGFIDQILKPTKELK